MKIKVENYLKQEYTPIVGETFVIGSVDECCDVYMCIEYSPSLNNKMTHGVKLDTGELIHIEISYKAFTKVEPHSISLDGTVYFRPV